MPGDDGLEESSRGGRGCAGRAIGLATLLLLMPGSKFLVLWLVDVIFGDAVNLGGFWLVTGLIITLVAARAGVRWLLAEQGATKT